MPLSWLDSPANPQSNLPVAILTASMGVSANGDKFNNTKIIANLDGLVSLDNGAASEGVTFEVDGFYSIKMTHSDNFTYSTRPAPTLNDDFTLTRIEWNMTLHDDINLSNLIPQIPSGFANAKNSVAFCSYIAPDTGLKQIIYPVSNLTINYQVVKNNYLKPNNLFFNAFTGLTFGTLSANTILTITRIGD